MRAAVRGVVFVFGASILAGGAALGGCSSFSAADTTESDEGGVDGGNAMAVSYAKSFGPGTGSATLLVGDLAVRSTGAAFVTGTYANDTIDVVGTTLPVPSGQDAFLLAIGGDGVPLFVRSGTVAKDQLGVAVAVSDDLLVQGTIFNGDLNDHDSGVLANGGPSFNIEVARLQDQSLNGVVGLTGPGNDQLRELAVIPGGDVIAFGDWNDMLTVTRPAGGDPGMGTAAVLTRTSAGGPSLFLARLFTTSGQESQKGFCLKDAICFASAMAASPAGDAVIAGRFSGTTSFDTRGPFTSSDGDAYVARLDGTFFAKWATVFAGVGVQEATAVALVPNSEEVVVAGTFDPELIVPGTKQKLTVKGGMGTDIFVTKLGADGAPLWVKTFGGVAADGVSGVAVDAQGGIYLAGSFESPTIDFGGPSLANAGAAAGHGTSDIFLARLGPDGSHVYSARFGGAEDEAITRLRLSATGDLYLAGTFTDTIDFGSGPLAGGTMPNGFIVKLKPGSR